ncbi:MAG: undecaprenyldiphospho-muramoylpentapeptide beta-N-acetylglucosaminyltransferase [Calditrichaeota bacterium]|nr:MAG: undecaprenyldiphospho-muramoylpentapeptide beta-N-acetylglucosaminyltransferase [Calditrichota bacterium]
MSEKRVKRVLITGGGTGGHIYPALAILEELKKHGEFDFLYVGGKHGIETRIVPEKGIAMETIIVSGFARSFTLKNLLFPVKLLIGLMQSMRIIRRFQPDVALGTGGYVSGPILYVAAQRGVPVLIFDADAYPGVTSRILGRYARRICLGFESARKYFRGMEDKIVFTGNPVRKGLQRNDREALLKKWGLSSERLTLLIFGGSQGARAINQAMLNIYPSLVTALPIQVLWQTGRGEFESVRQQLGEGHEYIKLVPYIEDMSEAYTIADVILCRAGATTLAELAIVAKPTILIPYPYSAGNHQVENAREIMKGGAAFMIEQKGDWEKSLKDALFKLFEDERIRAEQSSAWEKFARPNASGLIAEEILNLIQNENNRVVVEH